jgi:hypothetical protein
MYGMKKTTLYLPESLKESLERCAAKEGLSEAALIRRALQREVGDGAPPQPRIPLVEQGLGDPTVSERISDFLDGFGKR